LKFDENYNSTVPVAVQGDTDKPFLLVSFPGPQPNLHAVGNGYTDNLSTSQISCMIHKKQIKINSGGVTSSYSVKKLADDLFGGERFKVDDDDDEYFKDYKID